MGPERWVPPSYHRRQAGQFDGNSSDGLLSWLFWNPGAAGVGEKDIAKLLKVTVRDEDLSWAVFPARLERRV